MIVGITTASTLRSLADLIEAIDQDWPIDKTETAVNKAMAESKLLKVVGVTIRQELDEIESTHRKCVHDALLDVAMELAFENTMRTSSDRPLRLTDAIIELALMTPVEPAIVINSVATACKIDAPAIVQNSVRMLRDQE